MREETIEMGNNQKKNANRITGTLIAQAKAIKTEVILYNIIVKSLQLQRRTHWKGMPYFR